MHRAPLTLQAIYARGYNPQDLPADKLTHVNFAFANVKPDTGEVFLTDTWADTDKHYEGDSWNDTGTNVYGCIKQLNLLKRAHRNFKVLLSIGGWTYSSNFAVPFSTQAGRAAFATSAVTLLKDLGFDGIDIDYEYPATAQEAANYVLALQQVRSALDSYAGRVGKPPSTYLLSVASPAGPSNYQVMDIKSMDQYLDFWGLMAYDYAGGFSSATGHLANWLPSEQNPAASPFNTRQALAHYTSQGVSPSKIVVGMPLYGRAFASTKGMGLPFNGVGQGSWEAGVYDWKVLPLPGATVKHNDEIVASWSKDETKDEIISFDTLAVLTRKAQMVNQQGLGGLMWWEMSGDKRDSQSAVAAQVQVLGQGSSGIEQRLNELDYPESKYDNLRAGFPSG